MDLQLNGHCAGHPIFSNAVLLVSGREIKLSALCFAFAQIVFKFIHPS